MSKTQVIQACLTLSDKKIYRQLIFFKYFLNGSFTIVAGQNNIRPTLDSLQQCEKTIKWFSCFLALSPLGWRSDLAGSASPSRAFSLSGPALHILRVRYGQPCARPTPSTTLPSMFKIGIENWPCFNSQAKSNVPFPAQCEPNP